MIINADHGGTVVIMDRDSYIKETNRWLYDKASYKQLTQDPVLPHKRMVNEIMERFKNKKLFPKRSTDFIKVSNPKTRKPHISPKIHKPNNPRRTVNSYIRNLQILW